MLNSSPAAPGAETYLGFYFPIQDFVLPEELLVGCATSISWECFSIPGSASSALCLAGRALASLAVPAVPCAWLGVLQHPWQCHSALCPLCWQSLPWAHTQSCQGLPQPWASSRGASRAGRLWLSLEQAGAQFAQQGRAWPCPGAGPAVPGHGQGLGWPRAGVAWPSSDLSLHWHSLGR